MAHLSRPKAGRSGTVLAPGRRPSRRELLSITVPLAADTYSEDAQAKVAAGTSLTWKPYQV